MIISTLGGVGTAAGNLALIAETPPKAIFLIIVLHAIAAAMRDTAFNLAHWMFAYEYNMSASWMPYIYNREKMPEEEIKKKERINKVMLWASIIIPVVYNIMNWYDNWTYFDTHKTNVFQTSLVMFIFFSVMKYAVYAV
jgi:hypothetical protein